MSNRSRFQSSTVAESFCPGARTVVLNLPLNIRVMGDSTAFNYSPIVIKHKCRKDKNKKLTVRVITVLFLFPTSIQPSSSGGAASSLSSTVVPVFVDLGGLIACSNERSSSSRVSR